MSPPAGTSLALRGAHPPLALYWEELRRAEAKHDARAELLALNAVLKTYGPTMGNFGNVPGVPVGMIVLRRAELAVLGLHRHFLSEATFNALGVESLLLLGDERECEDGGERIVYGGSGRRRNQLEASHTALRATATARRAVRVVRVVAPEELGELEEAACAADERGGQRYRFDGLYYVQKNVVDDGDDDGDEPHFVLQRAPGQPPLAAAAGRGGKAQRSGGEHEPTTLSLGCELAPRPAVAELPDAAEVLLQSGGERLSVQEALTMLKAARDELLAALPPAEAWLLARRSVLNQLRLRSAIELLHAGDEAPPPAGAGAGAAPASDPRSWHPLLAPV